LISSPIPKLESFNELGATGNLVAKAIVFPVLEIQPLVSTAFTLMAPNEPTKSGVAVEKFTFNTAVPCPLTIETPAGTVQI